MEVTKAQPMSATGVARVTRWSTARAAKTASVLQAMQPAAVATAETQAMTMPTSATVATTRAAIVRNSAAPMKMMAMRMATTGPLAVAVPKVIDAGRSVIAGTRGIHVAIVLVLVVPCGRGNHRAVISAPFVTCLADVGVSGNGRSS
jgi:hypothetical protein